MQDQQAKLTERYYQTKSKLVADSSFPYSNSIFNLRAYVEATEALFVSLINGTNQAKPNRPASASRSSKKIPLLSRSKSIKTIDRSLTGESNVKGSRVSKGGSDINSKSPILASKQSELADLIRERETLEKEAALIEAVISEDRDAFELYDMMCRECETLRNGNNKLAQELKNTLTELNKLAGTNQNPNTYIANLKV